MCIPATVGDIIFTTLDPTGGAAKPRQVPAAMARDALGGLPGQRERCCAREPERSARCHRGKLMGFCPIKLLVQCLIWIYIIISSLLLSFPAYCHQGKLQTASKTRNSLQGQRKSWYMLQLMITLVKQRHNSVQCLIWIYSISSSLACCHRGKLMALVLRGQYLGNCMVQ